MKKILICGGHFTPAQALIAQFDKNQNVSISFIGRKYATEGSSSLSQEFKIITGKKIKFYSLTTGRLQRKFTKFTIPSLLKIPIGFFQSFFYLLITRPNIVVSFGGYLSCPVVISAWLLGIKSITHEQSILPGLANKINSIFVAKVYLSWKDSEKYFDRKKTLTIGNLLRDELKSTKQTNKQINSFLSKATSIIYVTGGNQGSHTLNTLILVSLKILEGHSFIHQVGATNFKGDLDRAMDAKSNNYLPIDYIESQSLGAILAKADFVISRSGANTVWELAALAKPSILIPLPIAAASEQFHNAKILENAGSAIILEEEYLSTKSLKLAVDEMENNLSKYKNAAVSFQKTLPSNASQKLKQEILRYT